MTVIVSRHAGQVEWLRRQGVVGPVISHVEAPEQIAGKVVFGNLPMSLAAGAALVVTVDLPGLKPEQRGQELSPEEMDAAGARLQCYRIQRYGGDLSEALDRAFREDWLLQTCQ